MLAGVALLAACSSPAGAPDNDALLPRLADDATDIPSTPAHIRGVLTIVSQGDSVRRGPSAQPQDGSIACPPSCGPSGSPLRFVLIEERAGEPRGEKARTVVLTSARIVRRTASGLSASNFGALRVGQQVETWFDGPVAESYPVQAQAGTIVIVDR